MQEITLYESESQYRDNFRIRGFKFGSGEKSLAVVGSLRGNEFQQLYACSHLVKKLCELEKEGALEQKKEILIIPCGNPYSMNIRKRFWTIDNTDINRMFPGYSEGETTQRIAASIFESVKDFKRGIQFASFYIRGSFAPHIRMMKTGFENIEMAKEFGLPYVVIREPRPFDTTTLNYNWQIWESNAFSLYTTNTEKVEKESAEQAVNAILRFMKVEGILLKCYCEEKNNDNSIRIVTDSDLVNVRTQNAGFFESKVHPGEQIKKGEVLAEIYNCYTAELLQKITSPCNGTILFLHSEDICYAESSVCKIIRS